MWRSRRIKHKYMGIKRGGGVRILDYLKEEKKLTVSFRARTKLSTSSFVL